MKKLLLTISVFASSAIGVMAQADLNFETWNNVFGSSTVQDPQGWASLNTLVNFGGTQSVFKETTAPFAGNASAKVVTVQVVGAAIPNPYANGNLDTAGILAIGTINFSPPGLKYGSTFSSRPTMLSFQSKYTPVGSDSAFVLAYLTKWNNPSGPRDTIATGKFATGLTSTAYSLNSLSMTYDPAFATIIPDTQLVFISSSIYTHNGARVGSAFYIDALAWSGWNSVNELNGTNNTISVYPNPATNNINFTSAAELTAIEISDITGRLIGSYSTNSNSVNISTSRLTPGTYIYTAFNKKKEVVGRNRFEITK
ncbi:MAG: T9SS type A sorting domain-containing protein [Bacteroidota bacterium]